MCLILFGKSVDDILGYEYLRAAMARNPDGCGIVFNPKKGNKLKVLKGMWTYDQLTQRLEQLGAQANLIAVHLRLATHGATVKALCHPFRVGDGQLMHNGVLSCLAKHTDKECSDSSNLARMLSKLGDSERVRLLEQLAGSFNRFLLAQPGKFWRFGDWVQRGKLWLSNTNCEPAKTLYSAKLSDAWWKESDEEIANWGYDPFTGKAKPIKQ